jgi:nucleoside-diphosphate-sugar epimerase
MTTFLVTGGAGFIGSNIVHELLKRGSTVRIIDNLATGRRQNLAGVWDDVEFLQEDICSRAACMRACEGVDAVLHLAALNSVPRSVKDPMATHTVNVTGTLTLLLAARDAGVRRVVFASSSSVYGNQESASKHEGLAMRPLAPYPVSKAAGEYYMKVFHSIYGLQTVVLRYFNVFGPRQDPNSPYAAVIPLFIRQMLKGSRPTIFGDGEQSRDFTYVQNNVEATIAAATATGVAGEVINIACGQSTPLNSIVAMINEALGTDIKPLYAPERPGDVRDSLADISKAQRLLGYEPGVDVKEGIRRTVEWLRTHPL